MTPSATTVSKTVPDSAMDAARPFGDRSSSPFIAYAVQKYPALRTTFVRREVEALLDLGLPIRVVSMRPADADELQRDPEAMSALAHTLALPAAPVDGASLIANGSWGIRRPVTWGRNALELGLADAGAPGWSRRLRLWLQIWRGAVMARLLERTGRCVRIHAHFADGAATTGLVCARLLGVPFSFTSHTSFDSPALEPKLRAADFVASISQFDRDQLRGRAGRSTSPCIEIVHCGIPIEQWPFQPRSAVGDPPGFLSVGALIDKKGHDVLIRACAILKRSGMAFRCRIVGGGPLHASLEALIRDVEVGDRVTLVGPAPQESVRRELKACDTFVLACKRSPDGDTDGIPVSLMEAMATGAPVVSTRIAGIGELVHDGVSGLLADPGDPAALADRLRTSVLASHDRDGRVLAARRVIEDQFHQQVEASRLAELFRRRTSLIADVGS